MPKEPKPKESPEEQPPAKEKINEEPPKN